MPIPANFPARDIAGLCLHHEGEKYFNIQLQSTEHRLKILEEWDIPKGAKVLEIGCGQGDCTAVLAELVGPNGRVDAVDPGALDYGGPYTLGQAQEHLSKSRLGSQINWQQSDPLNFLKSAKEDAQYDIAIMAICIWYFANPEVLSDIMASLATRAKKVYIAEWSLTASGPSSYPHVLAALAQAAVESNNPESQSNVRTIMSPAAITASGEATGWKLVKERKFTPAKGTLDGYWEVGAVIDDDYAVQAKKLIPDEKARSVATALRDAVKASLEPLDGKAKNVDSMDVWCGEFVRA